MKTKSDFNIEDYIATSNKLIIAKDKKRLIAYAKKEIKEWQKFLIALEKQK